MACETTCRACDREFSTPGNLKRHLATSKVCENWLELLAATSAGSSEVSLDPPACGPQILGVVHSRTSNGVLSEKYESFTPPKYSLCHIIWNVFLVDKEFIKKQDFKAVCEENNVKYIVSIVPDEQVFLQAVTFPIEHHLMIYENHGMDLDTAQFERQCEIIEEHRRRRDNVMVFCNNGYQRSLPFLCYYLFKYHNDEVPTLERALDMILPQVDKAAYPIVRGKYIASITDLFQQNGLLI